MPQLRHPGPPSQHAITVALRNYLSIGKKDAQQMIRGLSVLRHATKAQIHAAMPFVALGRPRSNHDGLARPAEPFRRAIGRAPIPA